MAVSETFHFVVKDHEEVYYWLNCVQGKIKLPDDFN